MQRGEKAKEVVDSDDAVVHHIDHLDLAEKCSSRQCRYSGHRQRRKTLRHINISPTPGQMKMDMVVVGRGESRSAREGLLLASEKSRSLR